MGFMNVWGIPLPELLIITLLPSRAFTQVLSNAAPRLALRQADAATTSCNSWLTIYDSCTAATPGFETLPVSAEASCLCYSASSWQPSVYDKAWATCVAYLSTASPALYSSFGGAGLTTNICQQAGDVLATGTGGLDSSSFASVTAGPTVTSPKQPTNTGACVSFNIIQESCALATPSFTTLSFSDEASCLCYASGTYAPAVFDGYWGGCLGFYSTASPSFYSSLGGDALTRTPCADIGDVKGTGVPSASNLRTTLPVITSTTAELPNPSILTTAVSTTATQSSAAIHGRADPHFWPIIIALCFLTLL